MLIGDIEKNNNMEIYHTFLNTEILRALLPYSQELRNLDFYNKNEIKSDEEILQDETNFWSAMDAAGISEILNETSEYLWSTLKDGEEENRTSPLTWRWDLNLLPYVLQDIRYKYYKRVKEASAAQENKDYNLYIVFGADEKEKFLNVALKEYVLEREKREAD